MMSRALRVTSGSRATAATSRQLERCARLGLRRIGQTVELKDTPQIRGMLHKVRHLVEVEES